MNRNANLYKRERPIHEVPSHKAVSNLLGAVMISDFYYMIIAAIIFTIKLLLQYLRDFGKKCNAK